MYDKGDWGDLDDGHTEMQRNEAAVGLWSVVDCDDRCSGWILTATDTWVRCRGCNSRGTVPHPEDQAAWEDYEAVYVVTVDGRLRFSGGRAAAADCARDLRDLGHAVRLRRVVQKTP